MSYVRRLRVAAETDEEARRLAVGSEQRCGAVDVRVEEVEDLGRIEQDDHVGVWRSPIRLDFYATGDAGRS